MMNKFISVAIATFLILGSVAAQAQSKSTSSTKSAASAVADVAAVGTIIMPGAISGVGAGAAASAASSGLGFNQPQLIMSTAGAPSTSTFNECGIAFSGGLWVLTFSYTGESKSCVAQRQALLALQMGQGNMAFELMCDVDTWKGAAERTASKGLPGPECQSTQVARAKMQPQTVSAAPVATPAPVRMVDMTNVPEAERCYNADGRVVGRVINGVCR
jgi:hypothetical protein